MGMFTRSNVNGPHDNLNHAPPRKTGSKRATAGACTVALLALLAIGACAAICGIVAVHLNDVTVSTNSGVTASTGQCALGSTTGVSNLCTLAYIGAGVGAGLALIMMVVACITCKCCGWGHILDFIIGIIGTAWMVAFGVLLLITSNQDQNENLPESQWRFGTWLTFFIGAGIFLLLTLSSGVMTCVACCGSKRTREERAEEKRLRRAEKEEAKRQKHMHKQQHMAHDLEAAKPLPHTTTDTAPYGDRDQTAALPYAPNPNQGYGNTQPSYSATQAPTQSYSTTQPAAQGLNTAQPFNNAQGVPASQYAYPTQGTTRMV